MTKHTGIFVNDPEDETEAISTLNYCNKHAPEISESIHELLHRGVKPKNVIYKLENDGLITVAREYRASAAEEKHFEEEYERYLREYGK